MEVIDSGRAASTLVSVAMAVSPANARRPASIS